MNNVANLAHAAIENTPTSTGNADLLAEIARLKAENNAMRKAVKTGRNIALRISVKGALSVYGLGRFPITLYKGQWEKLLLAAPEIRTFLDEHGDELSTKE